MNTDPNNDCNDSGADSRPEAEKIRVSLVHQLYTRGSNGYIGALIGAAVLVVALWNLLPRLYLTLWLAAYVLVYVLRLMLLNWYFKAEHDTADPRIWERRFAAGNIVGGLLWSVAAIFLFPENSVPHQYMLALFISGIACGAAALYWPSTVACYPTIVVELVPISGRFFFKADETGIVTGLVILLFCVVVLLMARHLNSFATDSLRLRFEKEGLAESLQKARNKLETRVQERTAELSRTNEELRHEISERGRAEESLSKSEERYRLVVENVQVSIFVVQDGRIRFVNSTTVELFQYSESELLSKPFIEFIHAADRELVYQNHLSSLKGEQTPEDSSCRILNKAGDLRWGEITSVVIQWDGQPAVLVFMTDITNRRTAEQALRESEERYRTFFDTSRDCVFITTLDGKFIDFNNAALEMFGYGTGERQDLMHREVASLYAKADERKAHIKLISELGFSKDYPVDLRKRDGTIIPTLITAVAQRDEQESVIVLQGTIRDITERKKAEEKLQTTLRRFYTILSSLYAGVLLVTEEGRIEFANQAFCDLFELKVLPSDLQGLTPSEMIQKIQNVFPQPVDAITRIKEIVAQQRTVRGEEIALNGGRVYLRDFIPIVIDGNLYGRLWYHQDITERKKAEDALAKSEERYRTLFENAPIGIFQTTSEGQTRYVNSYMAKLVGAESPEQAATHFTRLSQQLYYDSHRRDEFIKTLKEEGKVTDYEYEALRMDGSLRRFSMNARLSERYRDGSFLIEGFTSDITEQKLAQEALRDSEEKYRATFNNAAVGIDLVDLDGRFLRVNAVLSNFLGYTEGELRNLTILDVTYPEDLAKSARMHDALVRGETDRYKLEKRYVRKDGSVVWADTFVSAIRDSGGKHIAAVGVILDTTKRRKLDEVRLRLATAVEQVAETIVITDTEGTILYVNPAFEKNTGYASDEAIGKNPRILKSGQHDADFYQRLWKTIAGGAVWNGHLITKRKDGTLIEEEATISPIKDDSGEIKNYVAVKRDVTKEVSLQKQLFQAHKMEAVGTLAGGIAHDFNNLLQVTLGYSELILAEKSHKDPDYADLQKIHQAALSGAELVRSLLTFSRKVEPKLAPLRLNQQVTQVEKFLRRTIPKMIDIRLELAEEIQRTNADAAQIEQIIMNLAVNGRDAMGEEGSLTIRTENVTLDEEYCRFNVEAKPGDYVLLSVSDTGHGMDRETLQHIFEPFYTTKELGRGTGLGLAMVYGIVKQHGGHITCHSEVAKGTLFKLYFPAIQSIDEPAVEETGIMPAFGTETVLLVDDEGSVRELGERILTRSGYTVLTATNGEEALEVYGREKERIALVILDLIMPTMGGKDCLGEILKIDPQATILLASGYSGDASSMEYVDLGAKGFIAKPFRFKELLRQVRKTLDEG
jgi:two-component system, cell cycle sensor histidine kinase and response regulator CckA